MCICIYMCVFVYVYVCMYICMYICIYVQAHHPPPVGEMKCKNNRERLYPSAPSITAVVNDKHTRHIPRSTPRSVGNEPPILSVPSREYIPLYPPGYPSVQYWYHPEDLIPTTLADNININMTAKFSTFDYNK